MKKNSDSECYFMHLQNFRLLHWIMWSTEVSVNIIGYVKMDDVGAPQKWTQNI